ncbi:hypothetical protein CPG37_13705 [Malaciobacter canalis]|uniref:ABC-type transport auxiliary lipoprotein component domain-containing protein n=1 Tax=Malaciobacter canalis TaxID=1912871 RepID=A0ABX4LR41_9BACT|nr:hypothetical protein [Malaciobacter canalis]PHO08586.1 hypothetical protein CPG37_13705 [Malaciobacter canalis]QEE31825.1 putative lipid asymmetry ABC transporter MlaABCDEF component MlaB [Malaciobacter canalis]
MRTITILLISLVLFTGCSLKNQSLVNNSFLIKFDTNYKALKNTDKSIKINRVKVSNTFNKTYIFYSYKKYKLDKYSKNNWSDIPSNMIFQELKLIFDKSNLFNNSNLSNADYILNTNIFEIYNKIEKNGAYAVLNLNFELTNTNTKKSSFYNYNKEIKLEKNTPYDFVVAINNAFSIIVEKFLKDLESKTFKN